MAAAILLRNARILQDDDDEEENLLENLTAKLPPKETWEAELLLGIHVLG
jgi:hypothetical protein